MALFKYCIVCDDLRAEVGNKASVLGYYGILPHVELGVADPTLHMAKLTFVLVSGEPIPAGRYRIRLSMRDPGGRELLQAVGGIDANFSAAPANVALVVQPFPLAGAGTYTITAIVNDEADLSESIRVTRAPATAPD